ncbi:FAD-dependent oxidoreductase [Paraoerskovia marina]|uniref:FAD-dependent oxidoreductase n=1 Tax=Paraoerskovia marina TaxID=545619 RepID=UPI0009DEEC50|nr:FAD-dependent oxidoreductase [Paraoerskovia marina]
MSTPQDLPVVVIGGGPVGLAAAAHLVERGIEPLVLESGPDVGAAVAAWGHVRLFSPWQYDVDAAARRLLAPTGWVEPEADVLPTGAELVDRYLRPLAQTPAIAPHVRTGVRVLAVTRDGADRSRSLGRERRPFRLRVRDADGERDLLARAVVDATGTWGQSNPLGASGIPAVGEQEASAFVTGPLPDVLGRDRERFAGRRTLVVGRGHSAANTLLSLVELAESEPDTEITWAIRGGSARRLYGGGGADELPARGHLGERLRAAVESGAITLATHVTIDELVPAGDGVLVRGRRRDEETSVEVDAIVNATGFRPDLAMLREVRLDLDPVVEAPRGLATLIDPNEHSCGTVRPHGEALLRHPDEGFYVVGSKSYGRAPTFLLATGYEQVRSVVAALAGDRQAADAVELNLPSTGVCSADGPVDDDKDVPVPAGAASSSCC